MYFEVEKLGSHLDSHEQQDQSNLWRKLADRAGEQPRTRGKPGRAELRKAELPRRGPVYRVPEIMQRLDRLGEEKIPACAQTDR